ncbi:MAG: hypothetical protein KF734_18505 [Saprospiraceae bacterium]|nr:hypothetical protein [Saprospiraceae bacterium]
MRLWLKKWTTWEFLPFWLANLPMCGFWLWFAVRARHLVFFSNVNPTIPLGGAMGESKHDILRLLSPEHLPKTILVRGGEAFERVASALEKAGIHYPLIAKPDIGERGFLVKKISSPEALEAHLRRFPVDFILQEFLTLPVEMTVLFHRFPTLHPQKSPNRRPIFGITSVCIKEFLAVRGDGQSTVRDLMRRDARAAFQLERFEQEFPETLKQIPAPDETLLLEPIGNHCRGTKFLNGNHLIDEALLGVFQPVCEQLPGICYGRFDLKCESVGALRRGEFKVMELNGVFGEPAHVYDPSFGMWRAYRDFYRHWRLLFDLHGAQRRRGIQPTTHGEAWRFVRRYIKYKKTLGV